ncbi:hypothetical protein [Streptomyces sp. NPDC001903]|uniref:hypothetical protein n=1 Tax=Streptomyces sp. NPDC001903 TaxID=3364622 RepID=UPI003675BBCB
MNAAPRLRPCPPDPADGLRGHSAALRTHALRLRAAAEALVWQGPRADAFRAEVAALADRCATAANGLAAAADQLEDGGRKRELEDQ